MISIPHSQTGSLTKSIKYQAKTTTTIATSKMNPWKINPTTLTLRPHHHDEILEVLPRQLVQQRQYLLSRHPHSFDGQLHGGVCAHAHQLGQRHPHDCAHALDPSDARRNRRPPAARASPSASSGRQSETARAIDSTVGVNDSITICPR